jgi:hypothetical protein
MRPVSCGRADCSYAKDHESQAANATPADRGVNTGSPDFGSIAQRTGATRSRIIEEVSRLAFSNVADVLAVENGQLIVREHADLDRDTLSTVAEVSEVVNERATGRCASNNMIGSPLSPCLRTSRTC